MRRRSNQKLMEGAECNSSLGARGRQPFERRDTNKTIFKQLHWINQLIITTFQPQDIGTNRGKRKKVKLQGFQSQRIKQSGIKSGAQFDGGLRLLENELIETQQPVDSQQAKHQKMLRFCRNQQDPARNLSLLTFKGLQEMHIHAQNSMAQNRVKGMNHPEHLHLQHGRLQFQCQSHGNYHRHKLHNPARSHHMRPLQQK
ncbi:hypothetical protein V8G54_013668 [Vigna mungo]|uniref:Uncharacterized protein n=1 Tax=Vigna mungo TaxID=3915 RepID=A0AAQ3RXX9_VIGMU